MGVLGNAPPNCFQVTSTETFPGGLAGENCIMTVRTTAGQWLCVRAAINHIIVVSIMDTTSQMSVTKRLLCVFTGDRFSG